MLYEWIPIKFVKDVCVTLNTCDSLLCQPLTSLGWIIFISFYEWLTSALKKRCSNMHMFLLFQASSLCLGIKMKMTQE